MVAPAGEQVGLQANLSCLPGLAVNAKPVAREWRWRQNPTSCHDGPGKEVGVDTQTCLVCQDKLSAPARKRDGIGDRMVPTKRKTYHSHGYVMSKVTCRT